MTLPPLLRLSYWFDLTPTPFPNWVEYTLLGLFAVCFLGGLVVRYWAMNQDMEKMKRRAMERVSTMLVVLGCFGLLLSVLTYERIYGLGMRAGFLLWGALLAWYAYSVYRMYRIEMPQMEKRRAERDAINKWLPTSKK